MEQAISFAKDFLARRFPAAISMTAVAPMERVKLLQEVQHASQQITADKQYKGIIDCILRIPKEQGVLSFWQSNMANVICYFLTQSLYFAFKDNYKQVFLGGADKHTQFQRHFVGNPASGGAAGAPPSASPLDFAWTGWRPTRGNRAALSASSRAWDPAWCSSPNLTASGHVPEFQRLRARHHHLPGRLLRGVGHGQRHAPRAQEHPHLHQLDDRPVGDGVAGMVSYPFDTMRRQMMMQSGRKGADLMYTGTMDGWQKIFKDEGGKAFFKGSWSNV